MNGFPEEQADESTQHEVETDSLDLALGIIHHLIDNEYDQDVLSNIEVLGNLKDFYDLKNSALRVVYYLDKKKEGKNLREKEFDQLIKDLKMLEKIVSACSDTLPIEKDTLSAQLVTINETRQTFSILQQQGTGDVSDYNDAMKNIRTHSLNFLEIAKKQIKALNSEIQKKVTEIRSLCKESLEV